MNHPYIIYSVLLWLGAGIILAKESITEEQPIYLRETWTFLLVSLVAPLMAFAGIVSTLYHKIPSAVLFKKKESHD